MIDVIFTFIAAGLTLAIFSFLYKDNPFYKVAEHIYVGSAAAFWFLYLWFFDIDPKIIAPFRALYKQYGFTGMFSHLTLEHWILLIPITLSIFMLLRFIPPTAWISRWSIAFLVGMAAGLGITGSLQGYIIPQTEATLLPIYTGDLFTSFNNLIIIIATVSTIIYFFFSREQKGVIGIFAKIGITFIMIAFGASFGYTVMARVSLLIGRIHFLLFEWLSFLFS
ncbi:MAG: hypothetical protein ABDH49_00170 [Candidatus Hydrothermales bacterium]